MGRPPEEETVRHAKGLAQKLRDAAAEGQSPWTDEGTCLVFADAAKTLDSLADGVLAQARVIEQQRVALIEMLGSYRALVGRADVTAEQAENWDGPICAKRALAAVGETETPPEGTKP